MNNKELQMEEQMPYDPRDFLDPDELHADQPPCICGYCGDSLIRDDIADPKNCGDPDLASIVAELSRLDQVCWECAEARTRCDHCRKIIVTAEANTEHGYWYCDECAEEVE